MADTPDLSRVISMIMNNPKLIEEISTMAKADTPPEPQKQPTETETPKTTEASTDVLPTLGRRHEQRAKLLGAMKAYLSPERAKAVDTMMSILDILEMTGGRG